MYLRICSIPSLAFLRRDRVASRRSPYPFSPYPLAHLVADGIHAQPRRRVQGRGGLILLLRAADAQDAEEGCVQDDLSSGAEDSHTGGIDHTHTHTYIHTLFSHSFCLSLPPSLACLGLLFRRIRKQLPKLVPPIVDLVLLLLFLLSLPEEQQQHAAIGYREAVHDERGGAPLGQRSAGHERELAGDSLVKVQCSAMQCNSTRRSQTQSIGHTPFPPRCAHLSPQRPRLRRTSCVKHRDVKSVRWVAVGSRSGREGSEDIAARGDARGCDGGAAVQPTCWGDKRERERERSDRHDAVRCDANPLSGRSDLHPLPYRA